MSATYVPTGNTFGEGVGIPAFQNHHGDPMVMLESATSWPVVTPQSEASTSLTTPMDEYGSGREKLYPGGQQPQQQQQQQRLMSNASQAVGSMIPPEIAAQWPLDTVLIWLAKNQFSKDWQETFKALDLHGVSFLEIGTNFGGRGSVGMMHQQVYPRLRQECFDSGSGWDQTKEREEGKRLRRLIRSIVSGKPVDPSKVVTSHGRKDSMTISWPAMPIPMSAGTD